MDLNVLAHRLVQQATGEATPGKKKRLASQAGGRKGGAARAQSLSSTRRREIARKANAARWNKAGLPDPEKIG
jgi:hypothetical protein